MNFINKHKKTFFLILCVVCLCLAGITTNRLAPSIFEKTFGFVLTPVQGAVYSVGNWFSSRFSAVTNTDDLIKENEEMKLEIEKLKLENSRIELLEKDNKKLSGLLELSEKYKAYGTTGARIIGKDPGNWYDVFIIDKGSSDGLAQNMVVIADGGLVGRIRECGFNYSQVVSIIDDTDSVSAVSPRTGDTGYVKGDLNSKGMCKMELIDITSKITEGDEIATSHYSSVYPEGISIGKVVSIENASDTSTKTAVIEPIVDFEHLDSVLVITTYIDNPNWDETETTTERTTEEPTTAEEETEEEDDEDDDEADSRTNRSRDEVSSGQAARTGE
ncbi:MAG: rod shape-determining protein MreC [Eubacterium sp.]|nr:rod shape-determining protein MreC [Eubacterium sp.]